MADDLATRIQEAKGLEREDLIHQAIRERSIAVDVLASLAEVDRDDILRMIAGGRKAADLLEQKNPERTNSRF